MKSSFCRFVLGLLLLVAADGVAVVRYVNLNNPAPAAPYTSWSTAATNIQHAINSSSAGDLILVTNGVYRTGGTIVSGALSNRVAIDRAVTVRGVNGPGATIIEGRQVPGTTNGTGAVRCVYLASGAVLSGFTLTNGATLDAGDLNTQQCGGGAYCESGSGIITNCILQGNAAYAGGGAVILGTLNHCFLLGNRSPLGSGGGANSSVLNNCVVYGNIGANGGGAYGSVLNNCSVASNQVSAAGGGIWGGTANNSIVYHNTAGSGADHASASLNYSCATSVSGGGNITNEPRFVNLASGNLYLQSNSPCINAGNNSYVTSATDIAGRLRLIDGTVEMGAYEYVPEGPLQPSIAADYVWIRPGFAASFTGDFGEGYTTNFFWNFGDGTIVSNDFTVSHSWASTGQYQVVLTGFNSDTPGGVSSSVTINVTTQTVYYVVPGSPNPLPPYDSWATAAANIQDAVDIALPIPSSIVRVTNGVYGSGGRVVFGGMTNRLVVAKPIRVESVNGPASTVIQGFRTAGSGNGDGAIRCVFLGNEATLAGFTLSNGATRAAGDVENEWFGGGVYCESTTSMLTNCVLTGNTAYGGAAGGFRGTFNQCLISSNVVIIGNGGGVYGANLNNCVVTRNQAVQGGGAFGSNVRNCTVVLNHASFDAGGTRNGTLTNSIVYYNTSPHNANYAYDTLGPVGSSCTTPLASPDSISSEPQFVDLAGGDLRLSSNSFCINLGRNAMASGDSDFEGNPRIVGGAVDLGAYEFQSPLPMGVAIEPEFSRLVPGYAGLFRGYHQLGAPTTTYWDFGDGTIVSNNLYLAHSWSVPGDYQVTLWAFNTNYPAGVSVSVMINVATQQVYYVNVAGTNPISPFASWDTAATTIQAAVDAALPSTNSLVLVTNGIYQTGGRVVHGLMSNRVALLKPVQVRSVNGPGVTAIVGYQVPGITNGDAAVRCVFLDGASSVSGFTLTGGATRAQGNDSERTGGGVFSILRRGTIRNCILQGNSADVGGGGAISATLDRCQVLNNSTPGTGGAANSSILINCVVISNTAAYGGGAYGCYVNNSTLTANSAVTAGGGMWEGIATNSIAYYNTAPAGSNYSGTYLMFTCTTPAPLSPPLNGLGNFTNAPLFVDAFNGDFHLQSNSPAINTGDNNAPAVGTVDFDGQPRIVGGTIDVGAYEFQSAVPLVATIVADATNSLPTFAVRFQSQVIGGIPSSTFWDFGDGTIVSNTSSLTHAWASPGHYTVVFHAYSMAFPAGVTATAEVDVVNQIIYYVDRQSANPVPPFNSWATAATNIQDAVDAAVGAAGAVVLVTNGVYADGGRIMYGAMSNRVAIYKPIVVQSVNGPQATVIRGHQLPGTTNGDNAVRCAYLTNGAMLTGFTLTNGATRTTGDNNQERCGGAVLALGSSAIVSNCVLVGNAAWGGGGAVLQGTYFHCIFKSNTTFLGTGGAANGALLNNCAVLSNQGYVGGGSYGSILRSCTVNGNRAFGDAGGTWGGAAYNSIIYGNTSDGTNPNISGGFLVYCCTAPLAGGAGNISADPLFIDAPNGNLRLQSNSPCINIGVSNQLATTVDLDGNARIVDGDVDLGAFEFQTPVPLGVTITAAYTNAVPGYGIAFSATVSGGIPSSTVWDFGDGTLVSNTLSLTHAWASTGAYPVTFTALKSTNPPAVASVTIFVAAQHTYYVNVAGTNPIPPFLSWGSAATNVQDAIDAAVPASNSLVLVTNGIYRYGGRIVHGLMSNRVAITKPIRVQSVSGPGVTVIEGYQPAGGGGDNAVRGAYVSADAHLSGFTVTNGATRVAGNVNNEQCGGGVRCESNGGTVSNCVITGNSASIGGGGALLGTFIACSFTANSTPGTGGGANSCVLVNCVFSTNSAAFGGGAYGCTITNSSISGNTASAAGGGTWGGSMNNSIVYHNSAPADPNYSGGTFRFCCITPLAAGVGNFTNAPRFANLAANDLHLQSDSPCINSGNTAYLNGGLDRDGNPRISAGLIDLGAYEIPSPLSTVPFIWLWQHGLAVNSGTDAADADGDRFNNYQEWRAGTAPTNALSLLKLLNPQTNASGISLTWLSVAGTNYVLERTTDVTQPFTSIRSNLTGQAGTTTCLDTNAGSGGPYFYRVGVQ